MKLFKSALILITCFTMTIFSGNINSIALPEQEQELEQVIDIEKDQVVVDLTSSNASETQNFQRKDVIVDSKKAIEFTDKNGKTTVLCTTDGDADKAPKRQVVIEGILHNFFVTAEDAYRIGIQYLPNSISTITYKEYMSDGTIRSYEVHPNDKNAKVIYTAFIVTDCPEAYYSADQLD